MAANPKCIGLQLKGLLDRYAASVQERLAALPDDLEPDEAFDQLEAITREYQEGDCLLAVSRRRGYTPCPIPNCIHARPGHPAMHASLRFKLSCPATGEEASGEGILWHIWAVHGVGELLAEQDRERIGSLLARCAKG